MTVKECIEAALPLIHISSEARSVEITWHEDGTYSLTIMSEQAKHDLDQERLHNVAMGEKVVAGWHNSIERGINEHNRIIND